MEMLNSVSMLLGANLWQTLIGWFASWIVNYGWAIILFTVCLKLVLTPLDIFFRRSGYQNDACNYSSKEAFLILVGIGNNRSISASNCA